MDKATQMEVFVRVADTGGFSAAARTLRLTPSAVSKLIGRLEDRLGVRLFHRTTRSLSLTEEGRSFYERCVGILGEIEQAEAAISELHENVAGTLRITATVAFTRVHVLPLLPEFMALYPGLRVELELGDRPVDLVEDGFDVGLRMQEQMTDESLVARRLAVNRRVVCATPEYFKKFGVPSDPKDLLDHNCLVHSSIGTFNDWEFELAEGTWHLSPKGNFEANSAYALYEAVLAGIGVGRLATFLVQPDLQSGRLQSVLTEYDHVGSSILVVYPHRRHLSSKVRAFVDFLVERFSPVPPWERDEAIGGYRTANHPRSEDGVAADA